MKWKPIVAGLLISAGCQPASGELSGTYRLERSGVIDELTLLGDGRFLQRHEASGIVKESSGSWSYSRDSGRLELSGFRVFEPLGQSAGGLFIVSPQRSITGTVSFCLDPDEEEQCFRRQQGASR